MRRCWTFVALALLFSGCPHQSAPVDSDGRQILRLGYMPNLTHAPALLALQAGIFKRELGAGVVVETKAFNAGPSVIEGVFSGDLDVAYVGPNPAINGFVRSRGTALRVIAGSTSGGASLIVQPGIHDAAAFEGKRVASPAIANTQDVSLRTWLHGQGLRTTDEGGTVQVMPLAASDILTVFTRGGLAGAWVPEPTASRLVIEARGETMIDERSLWPNGAFPTTVVIASTTALQARPELVRTFLRAHVAAVRMLNESPDEARPQVDAYLREVALVPLPPAVLARAFSELRFTVDPLRDEFVTLADRAVRLGYLQSDQGIEGIFDESFLPEAAPTGGPPAKPAGPVQH